MAEALAIREVDLVMVMLMDMVLQVEGLVDRAAMVLRVKVMDRLVVGMVLEEAAASGAISNEKDRVGMTTGMPNDRDTRCGWVRYISFVLFSSHSSVRIRGLKFQPCARRGV